MRNFKTWAVLALLLTLAGLALGTSTSSAGPDPTTEQQKVINKIDADQRARTEETGKVPILDRATGAVVEVDPDLLAAERRKAESAPNFRDANGNPRYTLVWESGHMVPGPAITCSAPEDASAQPMCTFAGNGTVRPG